MSLRGEDGMYTESGAKFKRGEEVNSKIVDMEIRRVQMSSYRNLSCFKIRKKQQNNCKKRKKEKYEEKEEKEENKEKEEEEEKQEKEEKEEKEKKEEQEQNKEKDDKKQEKEEREVKKGKADVRITEK